MEEKKPNAETIAIVDSILKAVGGDIVKLKKVIETVKKGAATPADGKEIKDLGNKFGNALKKLEELKEKL